MSNLAYSQINSTWTGHNVASSALLAHGVCRLRWFAERGVGHRSWETCPLPFSMTLTPAPSRLGTSSPFPHPGLTSSSEWLPLSPVQLGAEDRMSRTRGTPAEKLRGPRHVVRGGGWNPHWTALTGRWTSSPWTNPLCFIRLHMYKLCYVHFYV
jgi:hypothetical protein